MVGFLVGEIDLVIYLLRKAHKIVMESADNQGAGEQCRPVKENMYQGYRP